MADNSEAYNTDPNYRSSLYSINPNTTTQPSNERTHPVLPAPLNLGSYPAIGDRSYPAAEGARVAGQLILPQLTHHRPDSGTYGLLPRLPVRSALEPNFQISMPPFDASATSRTRIDCNIQPTNTQHRFDRPYGASYGHQVQQHRRTPERDSIVGFERIEEQQGRERNMPVQHGHTERSLVEVESERDIKLTKQEIDAFITSKILPGGCRYLNCAELGKAFGNKSEWIDHHQNRHGGIMICGTCFRSDRTKLCARLFTLDPKRRSGSARKVVQHFLFAVHDIANYGPCFNCKGYFEFKGAADKSQHRRKCSGQGFGSILTLVLRRERESFLV